MRCCDRMATCLSVSDVTTIMCMVVVVVVVFVASLCSKLDVIIEL
jgi:hypothetical protein